MAMGTCSRARTRQERSRATGVPMSGRTASDGTLFTASGQEIQHDIRPDKRIPSRISVRGEEFRVVPEPREVDIGALELIDERLEEAPPSTD